MAYEPKTRPTEASVDEYIAQIADPKRRHDCETVLAIMQELTGQEPRMWGAAIVGFGSWFIPQGGKKPPAEWPRAGFSSRKTDLTIYLMPGYQQEDAALVAKLGKHKSGVTCLYLKRLSEVDLDVLKELIRVSLVRMRERHPEGA